MRWAPEWDNPKNIPLRRPILTMPL
jgi:hypothetical protein